MTVGFVPMVMEFYVCLSRNPFNHLQPADWDSYLLGLFFHFFPESG